MNKGDIVLIPFPFTDLSGLKNRPALILIAGETDITLSFKTTQLKWEEPIDVIIEPSLENGIKRTSIIRLCKIATLDKDLVLGKLGNLSKSEMATVNNNLIEIFKLN